MVNNSLICIEIFIKIAQDFKKVGFFQNFFLLKGLEYILLGTNFS